MDAELERTAADRRKGGTWRRIVGVSSVVRAVGVIVGVQMNRPDLTPAERAQPQNVRQGNELWLEQAALGIGMKHPGEAFRPMATLPEPIVASIKKTGEDTCEAFGF